MNPFYKIQLNRLWEFTKGDPAICIAIIDSAVDLSHEAFNGSDIIHLDNVGQPITSLAPTEHGTLVASLIFGNHESEIKGICPNTRGMIIPIFGLNNQNKSTQLELSRAIHTAIDNGAHIINISAGELNQSGAPDEILKKSLERCEAQNVLVIAAAGNDGCDCVHIPASESTVLTVGGLNESGTPLNQSNFGAQYKSSGILAPSENIKGAGLKQSYIQRTGTSFATPIVSGIAGLIRSQFPSLKPSEIRNLIIKSAVPCPDNNAEKCTRYLQGSLNIEGIISYFKNRSKLLTQRHLRTNKIVSNFNNSKNLITMEQNQINQTEKTNLELEAKLTLSEAPEVNEQNGPSSIENPDTNIEVSVQQSPSQSMEQAVAPSGLEQSCGSDKSCGCGGSNKSSSKTTQLQRVYALGTIGFDFVNGSRRDSFLQHIGGDINNPKVIIDHLEKGHLTEASELIWTLNQEGTPIYAIHPHGPFASEMYKIIVDFMKGQLEDGVERVSIPGIVAGELTLLSGQVVPAIAPTIRGMASWSTKALVASLGKGTSRAALSNFLERVYHEFRNFGSSSQDRALNFAATNAFQANSVFQTTIKEGMQLTDIEVVRSPIVRPGVDGWDVQLSFFDPKNRYEKAKKMYKYTVDVSDTVPVTIGSVRSWWVY